MTDKPHKPTAEDRAVDLNGVIELAAILEDTNETPGSEAVVIAACHRALDAEERLQRIAEASRAWRDLSSNDTVSNLFDQIHAIATGKGE